MKLKAISEVLAVLILVVLSMVVGALFYAYVSSMFAQLTPVDQAFVSVEGLTPPLSTRTFFTFTVKDVGTASIVGGSFKPAPNVPSGSFQSLPAPGQTASGSVMGISSSNAIAGSSYTYQIVVQFANGVEKTYTGAVTAESY